MTPEVEQGRVLMVGPDLTARGGMTSVIEAYLSNWKDVNYEVCYVGTYSDNPSIAGQLRFFIRAFVEYCKLLFFWKPSLVHIHASQRGSYLRKGSMMLLARAVQAPVIWHSHGSELDRFYDSIGSMGQRIFRWLMNQSALIIVLSAEWKRFFDSLELTVRTEILYNPSPLPYDKNASSQSSTKQGIVLSLGRLGHRKGTYDILAAVPTIAARFPESNFVLAGDGEIETVRRLVKEHHLEEHVSVLGWIDKATREENLSKAGLFLLPSYGEGLPMAILEAMSYALPVISTPVGGIPEAVEDGVTGFLVQPGDVEAIIDRVSTVLENPQLAHQLGTNGMQKARMKFGIVSVLTRLSELYDSVLTTARP